MNYFEEENANVLSHFNLSEVLEFTLNHDVQIVRGEDYQYQCYIGKVGGFATSLTPMHALWFGIKAYKSIVNKTKK